MRCPSCLLYLALVCDATGRFRPCLERPAPEAVSRASASIRLSRKSLDLAAEDVRRRLLQFVCCHGASPPAKIRCPEADPSTPSRPCASSSFCITGVRGAAVAPISCRCTTLHRATARSSRSALTDPLACASPAPPTGPWRRVSSTRPSPVHVGPARFGPSHVFFCETFF
ncbi:uncharacterized protein [Triticum aestivum]|uniref:uncharacterized protein isoform X1 n=1 Tax=Triticum aestivum TaxID=4565 RepID=UPI001D02A745|nr:uncharacterized protein LOC123041603 isoform X1 [Triticum aestivum]